MPYVIALKYLLCDLIGSDEQSCSRSRHNMIKVK